jgi:uncharacterized membrane-anchored protein YhcB (DUF1043 family)
VYSLTVLIAAAVAALILGAIVGSLYGMRSTTGSQKAKELEQKLDQVVRDRQVYEEQVVAHFADTAQKLNALTESYREVHNHIARGAASLCEGKGSVAVNMLEGNQSEIPSEMINIEPPRDYAPKSSPDAKGVLDESFGLEKEDIASRPPVKHADMPVPEAEPEAESEPEDAPEEDPDKTQIR